MELLIQLLLLALYLCSRLLVVLVTCSSMFLLFLNQVELLTSFFLYLFILLCCAVDLRGRPLAALLLLFPSYPFIPFIIILIACSLENPLLPSSASTQIRLSVSFISTLIQPPTRPATHPANRNSRFNSRQSQHYFKEDSGILGGYFKTT